MEHAGLLLRLRDHWPYASAAERNIINYLEHDPNAAIGFTISELAHATYTSPSTIIRLCRKLGCSGYKDFQRNLVVEMTLLGSQEDVVIKGVDSASDLSQIVSKVIRSDYQTIEATAQLIDVEQIELCAQKIIDATSVSLFGLGASLLVAHDLEQKLIRAAKPCICFDDWHMQLLAVKNMTPQDVAIIFSYSGLSKEMLEAARLARACGSFVIAITRIGETSKLARMADATLAVAASEPLERSGAMASRISQLLIVDALFAAYVTKDYSRCSSFIRRNYIGKSR